MSESSSRKLTVRTNLRTDFETFGGGEAPIYLVIYCRGLMITNIIVRFELLVAPRLGDLLPHSHISLQHLRPVASSSDLAALTGQTSVEVQGHAN